VKRKQLSASRRIVVKIGTSLLTSDNGEIHSRRFGTLAAEISELLDARREVVLVSSGAVGLGFHRLGRKRRPSSIPEVQAAAAIGQIDLCRRFERAFARHDRVVGQILLTHGGLADRERFLNARRTLQSLLGAGAVPVINENDSVSTEELRFGDNDQLSAMVVNCCSADLLVMLSDIDGLHDRHPSDSQAQRISEVEEVDRKTLPLATNSTSKLSRGGMRSKLEAARLASRSGVPVVIADGRKSGSLRAVLAGADVGTLVHPAVDRLSSRKHWIAYSLKPRGSLRLDAGAVRAIRDQGRSLLPIGVTGLAGRFKVGDLVVLEDERGREIARGLASYDAADLERIKGQKTPRIADLLGYSNGSAAIHRDDLVLL
jgi:glutamate 5-kinase